MVCPVDGIKSARAGSVEIMEGTRLYFQKSFVRIETWPTSSRSISAISGSNFLWSGKYVPSEISVAEKGEGSGTTNMGGDLSVRRSLCKAVIEFLVSRIQLVFEEIAFSKR